VLRDHLQLSPKNSIGFLVPADRCVMWLSGRVTAVTGQFLSLQSVGKSVFLALETSLLK